MTWLDLALGSLATFRLALLISSEDGPAWIFRKLRNVPPRKSSAHEGIRCIWCVSMWMSILVTTFFYLDKRIEGQDWALYWLSFSAGGIILNQTFTKGPK